MVSGLSLELAALLVFNENEVVLKDATLQNWKIRSEHCMKNFPPS